MDMCLRLWRLARAISIFITRRSPKNSFWWQKSLVAISIWVICSSVCPVCGIVPVGWGSLQTVAEYSEESLSAGLLWDRQTDSACPGRSRLFHGQTDIQFWRQNWEPGCVDARFRTDNVVREHRSDGKGPGSPPVRSWGAMSAVPQPAAGGGQTDQPGALPGRCERVPSVGLHGQCGPRTWHRHRGPRHTGADRQMIDFNSPHAFNFILLFTQFYLRWLIFIPLLCFFFFSLI